MFVPCYDCGDEVVVDEDAEIVIILCDTCSIDYEYAFVPDESSYI